MIYEVSYDLNKPGQDYPDLYTTIKELGDDCRHAVDSTWFVKTNLTATAVRDRLLSVVDQSDSIIVVRAVAPAAWSGLSDDVASWLKSNL